MPTQPQPPARPAQPPARPQQPAQQQAPGATVAAARTYPPGSRYNERTERTGTGPDPQEAKLRPYALAATVAADEPVMTVAQEQRARSEAMQEEGVERFKARSDDRDPNERPRSVPGVGFRPAAGEGERSTPEARAAQNKASP